MDSQFDSKQLEPAEVKSFIESLGYTVEGIDQEWRNMSGKISKDGQSYFFKLGSTPEISQRTLNEVSFYNYINSLSDNPIPSPKVITSGNFQDDLYWFITEWIEGELLVQKDNQDPLQAERLEENLGKILEYLIFLDNHKPQFTLSEDANRAIKSQQDRILRGAEKFSREIDGKKYFENVYRLVEFLKENIKDLELVLTHNDFVPWHIIRDRNNNLFAVDAEHASFYYHRFHDVATFYHRIFVYMNNPKLASLFLDKVKVAFKIEDGSKEENQLKIAIASRLIGGYWESVVQNWSRVEVQDEIYLTCFE